MPRLPDWPDRLIAFVAAREHVAFAWGAQDCCSFAADCAIALTGEDPMQDLRGAYDDAKSATRLLATPLAQLIGDRLPEIPRGLAQRGDIVIVDQDGRDAAMIVDGEWLIGAGPDGLVRVPRRLATRAFHVG